MALPSFLAFTRIEMQTYLILSVCWTSIIIVNMLEQPYARSLVICEEPVTTAQFSGSKFCGNRLHVIDTGAKTSGMGQSLENVGRILITFFVSGFADRGRRRAAILGQLLITSSTVLFFFAGFASSWAIPCYVIAQGLQGMSGIGILDQIVTGDVALQTNDSVGVYQRKNTFMAILMFVAAPLICYIQYAEFTDFTYVWLAVVGMNTSALLLLICFFPETLSNTQNSANKSSLLVLCRDEIQTFWSLITTNRLIKWRLIEVLLGGLSITQSIGLPTIMAYFGYSQITAFLATAVPMMGLSPFFMPLVPYLFKQDPRFYFQACYWFGIIVGVGYSIFYPFTIFGMPMPILAIYLRLPLAGFMSVVQAVEIRLVGVDNNAKYAAMMQLVGFLTDGVTSSFYTMVFDAEATTYFSKNKPLLLALIPSLLAIPGYIVGNSPLQLAECDKMAAEEAVKAAEESAKAAATDSSVDTTEETKKTN